MTDQEMANVFHAIYNEFWLKWRHRKIVTDDQWQLLIQEARELAKKYPQKIAIDMLTEIQMEIKKRQEDA